MSMANGSPTSYGLVVKIKATDEEYAGIIARDLAETLEDTHSSVVDARWDNCLPEEVDEA